MDKRLRLLIVIPNKEDATSFYRASGPLSDVVKRMEGLELVEATRISWPAIAACDAVFVQRACTNDHLKILGMAAGQHKPVWLDYDDNLLAVPRSNPSFRTYGSETTRNAIKRALEMATVVSVSTQALHDGFRGHCPGRMEVIPNGLPLHIIGQPKPLPDGVRPSRVFWRGSSTHHEDLDAHLEALTSVIRQLPNTSFVFRGDAYWKLANLDLRNIAFLPGADPVDYFADIATMKPRITIVPLISSTFNRAKSNIAQLEALWAGSLPIVPAFDEWRKVDAGLSYDSPEDFGVQLSRAILMDDDELNGRVIEGRKQVMREFTLETTNRKRIDLLKSL